MNTLRSNGLKRPIIALALVLSAFAMSSASAAGYGYDPAAHKDLPPGNVYFGSAKDADGEFVAGATIVLETKKLELVTVTDPTGRYRLELPTDIPPTAVTARCSRKGYALGETVKRLPRGGEVSPVEINCILKK